MVTIVKSEWHQVERRYAIDFDEVLLAEIYPDLDEDDWWTDRKGGYDVTYKVEE